MTDETHRIRKLLHNTCRGRGKPLFLLTIDSAEQSANVRFQGGTVDLGPVQCLENDSPDADTNGFGDVADPNPGLVFFFLYRGSQGLSDPGSYGQSSDGRERSHGGGGC